MLSRMLIAAIVFISVAVGFKETAQADIFHESAQQLRLLMKDAGMVMGSDNSYLAIHLSCMVRAPGQAALCAMKDVNSFPFYPNRMKVVTLRGTAAITMTRILRENFRYADRNGEVRLNTLYCAQWNRAPRPNFCKDSY